MEKKTSFSRTIKIIGNIAMIVAIIFIIRRLLQYSINYKILFEKKNLFLFFALVIAYSISVIICSYPWKNAVYLITDSDIRFLEVAEVSVKANVLKYIPGNIFQYIGRNDLAIKKGLKHTDVAVSTLLDIAINFGAVFVLTIVCAFDTMKKCAVSLLKMQNVIIVLLIVIGLVIWVMVFLWKKKDNKYKNIFKRIFCRKGMRLLFTNSIIYILVSLYTTGIYMIVLYVILGETFKVEQLFYVGGAVLASWMIGFITPGAPGGMGVRETALIMMLGGIIEQQVILLSVIANRVVSIFGDILAFIVIKGIIKVHGVLLGEEKINE